MDGINSQIRSPRQLSFDVVRQEFKSRDAAFINNSTDSKKVTITQVQAPAQSVSFSEMTRRRDAVTKMWDDLSKTLLVQNNDPYRIPATGSTNLTLSTGSYQIGNLSAPNSLSAMSFLNLTA